MNDLRASYTRFLPLVLLGAFISTVLHVYHDVIFDPQKGINQLLYLSALIVTTKYVPLWLAVGLAFRQMKEAMIALGVALLLFIIDTIMIRIDTIGNSTLYSDVSRLLNNVTFVPGLTFGMLCLKKRSLPYFLPLGLLAYGFSIAFTGSCFLDTSPYNIWYKLLRVQNLTRIQTGENTYLGLNLFFYAFNIFGPCILYILVGESYNAAAGTKKLKDLFKVNLAINYTKAGAITLFIGLRLFINMLVIGIFIFPTAYFFGRVRMYIGNVSAFSSILIFIGALALLAAVVLYYRKFLVEYFIGNQQKIDRLFWFVNVPIIGLLIFPFVAHAQRAIPTQEERTHFFYNDALNNGDPYGVMGIMIGLSLLSMLILQFVNGSGGNSAWVFWIVELCLFIWYVAAISGYYVILGLGACSFAILLLRLFYEYITKGPASVYGSSRYIQNQSLWYITAFTVLQYVILLPVFHLHFIKIEQEPPAAVDEMEVGIPTL